MDNNTHFTPVFDSSAAENFAKMIMTPEMQNHMAIQAQENIKKSLKSQINLDIDIKNPNQKVENLLAETNEKLEQQILINQDLQKQVDEAQLQLKQPNDKESSQKLYIKELKADLKEETERRIKAENTLSPKDLKLMLISFISGIIVTIVGGIILNIIIAG